MRRYTNSQRPTQSGQGLVPILAGMTLLGFMALGSLRLISGVQVQQNILSNEGDRLALRQALLNVVSNSSACATALQNSAGTSASFNPDNPKNASQNSLNKIGIGPMILAQAGVGSGRFRVQSLSLTELDPLLRRDSPPTISYAASLNLVLEKRTLASAAWVDSTLSIPLFVETDSQNIIVRCLYREPATQTNELKIVRAIRYAKGPDNIVLSGRPIQFLKGDQDLTAVESVNNVSADPDPENFLFTAALGSDRDKLDGLKCATGWKLLSCNLSNSATGITLSRFYPIENGCVTPEFDASSSATVFVYMTITCMK